MKYYEQILNLKCFSVSELAEHIKAKETTVYSLLRNYEAKGYVKQIRRNLYVAISMESQGPVASCYEIASKLTPTAYVSYTSALAYYGYMDQVSHELYVSSESKFNSFEFDFLDYRYIASRIPYGIVEINKVRITDIERTIIDCINQFDHIGGLEELLKSLAMIPYLSEEKLLIYLKHYDKAILFQKAGYILQYFKESLKLSSSFFEECKKRKGKSIRYFSKSYPAKQCEYDSIWGLMVSKKKLDDILKEIQI